MSALYRMVQFLVKGHYNTTCISIHGKTGCVGLFEVIMGVEYLLTLGFFQYCIAWALSYGFGLPEVLFGSGI